MTLWNINISTEKKQQMMLKKRDTRLSFDHSRDALKRFESIPTTQLNGNVFEEAEEDSQEDEGEYQLANEISKVITILELSSRWAIAIPACSSSDTQESWHKDTTSKHCKSCMNHNNGHMHGVCLCLSYNLLWYIYWCIHTIIAICQMTFYMHAIIYI